MPHNPISLYVKCELRMTLLVRKGVIVPDGALELDGKACIVAAIAEAISVNLPEGITTQGSSLTIEDL